MLTRSKIIKGEGELAEEDLEIGSRIWRRKQIADRNESIERNVYAKLDSIKTMIGIIFMIVEEWQYEEILKDSQGEGSSRNNTH